MENKNWQVPKMDSATIRNKLLFLKLAEIRPDLLIYTQQPFMTQMLMNDPRVTWVLLVGGPSIDVGLLGGDRGSAAVGASGRYHGGRGGGGGVVTRDLAGDGAKLGHWYGAQAGALRHRGRGCGHCRRGGRERDSIKQWFLTFLGHNPLTTSETFLF